MYLEINLIIPMLLTYQLDYAQYSLQFSYIKGRN